MASKQKLHGVRCSFPALFKPKAMKQSNGETGTPKYQITAMIPKDDEKFAGRVRELKAAEDELLREKFGDKANSKKLKRAVKDGDEEDREEWKNHWIISMRTDSKPGVVDQACRPVTDEQLIMPGDYVNISFNLYAYDVDVNKGVAAGLNNVQFYKKGEPLGNRVRAEDDFEPVEVADGEGDDFF